MKYVNVPINEDEDEDQDQELHAKEGEGHEEGHHITTSPKTLKSYFVFIIIYFIYGISFGIAIPVFPALTSDICHDDGQANFIYGAAMSVRYGTEFVFGPIMGTLSDHYGRKPFMVLSFLMEAFEFLLLMQCPSLLSLFIARSLSGIGDQGLTTAYAMVTDIANHNGHSLTEKLGQINAVFAFAFLLALPAGGILTDYSIHLCLMVSAGVAIFGAVVTYLFLEDTLGINHETAKLNFCEFLHYANPLKDMKAHFKHKKLRQLIMPYAVLQSSYYGVLAIWILSMRERFDASSTSISVFLSYYSLMNIIVQGEPNHILPYTVL